MRAPKHYKTLKKERYFAIAKPVYEDVNGVSVTTGRYLYFTKQNTFRPLGARTKRYEEPVTPTLYAAENIDGYCETHLIETNIKEWIV